MQLLENITPITLLTNFIFSRTTHINDIFSLKDVGATEQRPNLHNIENFNYLSYSSEKDKYQNKPNFVFFW